MKKNLLVILIIFFISILFTKAQTPVLWGLTSGGGSAGMGTIFKTTSTGAVTSLHDLGTGTDGQEPFGSLIKASNGLLYGMTQYGGAYGFGVIVSYNISTGIESDVHDFNSDSNGYEPYASLLQVGDSLLYGLTMEGGDYNGGVIFSFNVNSNTYTKLYDFGNPSITADGYHPYGNLLLASNSLLYGTTQYGGTIGIGNIFSYDISTGVEANVWSFGIGTDGAWPVGSLVAANNGLLYGLTAGGGVNDSGTIFSFNPAVNLEDDVHDFSGADGAMPDGSLLLANNGLLYGLTANGGTYCTSPLNGGVIFSFDITTNNEIVLHNFGSGTDGAWPNGSLIQASNNLLYGMTAVGGDNSSGIIFSYNISSSTETDIHDFTGTDGASPSGDLLEVDTPTSAPLSVWPGDANDDLTVNNYDLLPIGLYYGDTGTARTTITNTWAAQPAAGWGLYQANGYDLKFVDCNGDGIINSDDTLAVTLNYGDTHLSHSPRSGPTKERSGGAPLYFVADSASYSGGSVVHITVLLGNVGTAAVNFYGLVYDINLDNSLIQPGTLSFNYTNSFLGTKNSDALSLTHIGEDVETAVTRIDHGGRSGYGKIGDLYFTLNASVNKPQLAVAVSSYMAIDNEGNMLTLQPLSDTLNINTTTGVKQLSVNNNQLSVFPNPNSGEFTIRLNNYQNGYTLEVYNIMGEKIYQSVLSNLQNIINLDNQPAGLYFVYLKSNKGVEVSKLMITK